MVGGPPATLYGVSESSWMDGPNFLSWFTKLFLPAVNHLTVTGPVVLFLDGHHSHISLDLIRKARDSNVIIMCLPPNTTHAKQRKEHAREKRELQRRHAEQRRTLQRRQARHLFRLRDCLDPSETPAQKIII